MPRKITLVTLPEASEQEVFDQVAAHLLTQKKRSLNGGGDCVYQSDDGLQCAAGCLIGERNYRESFESRMWENLAAAGLVPSKHCDLIMDLQYIHDGNDPHAWPELLKSYAEQHGLSPATVQAMS